MGGGAVAAVRGPSATGHRNQRAPGSCGTATRGGTAIRWPLGHGKQQSKGFWAVRYSD